MWFSTHTFFSNRFGLKSKYHVEVLLNVWYKRSSQRKSFMAFLLRWKWKKTFAAPTNLNVNKVMANSSRWFLSQRKNAKVKLNEIATIYISHISRLCDVAKNGLCQTIRYKINHYKDEQHPHNEQMQKSEISFAWEKRWSENEDKPTWHLAGTDEEYSQ